MRSSYLAAFTAAIASACIMLTACASPPNINATVALFNMNPTTTSTAPSTADTAEHLSSVTNKATKVVDHYITRDAGKPRELSAYKP